MPSSNAINGHLLNRAVLVLNANYSPMMICTARRAICLDYLRKVEVLVNYDEQVHSPSLSLHLPSVIKIRDYIRFDNLSVDLNRKNVIARDNHICQYCGVSKTALTIDHIIPKGKGGLDTWENLVAACKPCNQRKGDKTIDESNMLLNRLPKRPNRLMYFQKYVKDQQQNWRPYLFMEPFTIN
ncbi:MAG: HNH endonuclease [Candidatus Marinimicrobia bacterium]|jgi:5-methylcytosine-specific restriction endonuclease McrA|nr:HNH endonuclease [Candidatus Neomarinimicrobiota bacterium]MBT4578684.1 HNH endonuclease [Candidatus Neomarinimicrobiota bacterium]MBT4957091.1 HNH endonuclease [Candidatus Neomarinimicrobiota bacterium]MBT7278403.1 HNH endonuclease [Candidatus Neomarinimicrobiota bacterium]MBT7821685.1 HNH endonuclease [Candidatus Neomarinimicrobiota bacterium]